jgi:hypothetical protein
MRGIGLQHRAWCFIAAAWVIATCPVQDAYAESAGGEGHGAPAAAEEEVVESDGPIRGVSLGDFRIQAYHAIEAKRSTLSFTLYAVVSSDNAPAFKHLIENRRHKVRDQVITIARLSSLADFDQPQLTDFRRRILLRLRRIMPELQIDDLYISDFRLNVQNID